MHHDTCIPYRVLCWLLQANEQLEAQLREAQRAQQASEAQAGQLQAAENRVRCVHACTKRLPDALQDKVAYQHNIYCTEKLGPMRRGRLPHIVHSIMFRLTQQLHLCACSSHLTVSAMVPLQASARAAERGAVLHVLWLRQALLQSQLQLWSVSRRSWSWRVQGRRRRQRQGAWQPSWRACAVRDQQSHPGYVTHTIRLVKDSRLRLPFAHVSQLTCVRELPSLHKTGPANTDRCLTILPPLPSRHPS